MKKPLILFIIFVVLFVVAKIAYNKYCASKPEGCKKVKVDENQGLPEEGVDW
ncbi:MAG: hypothetical protein U9R13_05165 [Campylobacterota bacterium]|nr:hypothetical protein [Campylobacterota bacterium]